MSYLHDVIRQCDSSSDCLIFKSQDDSLSKIIKWVLVQLNVHTFGDLYRNWDKALDWFFYFNKGTGCGVPDIEEVRRYI